MILDMQEMFNAAYIGLSKQGWVQSRDNKGNCLYRGPSGRKCAIGFCMTDDEAALFAEDDSSYEVLKHFGVEEYPMFKFAEEMQRIHDKYDVPSVMKSNFEEFAERHKLTIPSV